MAPCISGILAPCSRGKAAWRGLARWKKPRRVLAPDLRAPMLLLTNGETLKIWQLQKTLDSVRVLATPVSSLPAKRGEIERLLSKRAVLHYCKTFQVKTILEASADYGRFEIAELSRILRHERQEASIDRTLVRGEQASLEFLASEQLLDKCSHGAIIVVSSGYGKTTLCRRLLRKAIEERQRTIGRCCHLMCRCPISSSRTSPFSTLCASGCRLIAQALSRFPPFRRSCAIREAPSSVTGLIGQRLRSRKRLPSSSHSSFAIIHWYSSLYLLGVLRGRRCRCRSLSFRRSQTIRCASWKASF